MKFCVIFFFLNLGALTAKEGKRILLHSDTDVQTEIVRLRNEFAVLKTEYNTEVSSLKANMSIQLSNKVASLTAAFNTEVASLKANMSSENTRLQQVMNSENTRLQQEMNSENTRLQQEINSEKARMQNEVARLQSELSSRGSTYVRWGKESCNTNGTTLIYKGYMAGKAYNTKGSGTNSLCLPDDPTWGHHDDGDQHGWRGYIYGAEFEVNNNVYFGKHAYNEDIPCAVCKVPGTSVMIPARVNCYPGWKVEYTGYLMSDRGEYYSTNYVCVDGDPDFVIRGAASTDGHVMYLVEGICGTLACPPYVNHRELACVVCSL